MWHTVENQNHKTTVIRARITEEMHDLMERLAQRRGESMSFVLREAVREFAEKYGEEERPTKRNRR